MTITIQPSRRSAPRSAPDYRRRRLVAGAVACASTLAIALALSVVVPAGSGGGPAAASGATAAAIPVRYVARPGDTLWSIAEVHHGDVELRRYLDALVELNGGTAIQAGQAVRLP